MKKQEIVQVVHDNEQQEKDKTNSKKDGNQETNLRENINSERRIISKSPTPRPLKKTTLA